MEPNAILQCNLPLRRQSVRRRLACQARAVAGQSHARQRREFRIVAALRAAGMTLVLDGLSHHALLLARPAALEPDLQPSPSPPPCRAP